MLSTGPNENDESTSLSSAIIEAFEEVPGLSAENMKYVYERLARAINVPEEQMPRKRVLEILEDTLSAATTRQADEGLIIKSLWTQLRTESQSTRFQIESGRLHGVLGQQIQDLLQANDDAERNAETLPLPYLLEFNRQRDQVPFRSKSRIYLKNAKMAFSAEKWEGFVVMCNQCLYVDPNNPEALSLIKKTKDRIDITNLGMVNRMREKNQPENFPILELL